MGSYRVLEALPVTYDKTWPDGQPTPGVCLLTFFRRKPGLSQQNFLDRWHKGHTPLSLKIHPLWNYIRNVVQERMNEPSEIWDGLVEEQFYQQSNLLNPFKFFGKNPLLVPYRMWQVYSDVRTFLDYPSIETYFAKEIIIRS